MFSTPQHVHVHVPAHNLILSHICPPPPSFIFTMLALSIVISGELMQPSGSHTDSSHARHVVMRDSIHNCDEAFEGLYTRITGSCAKPVENRELPPPPPPHHHHHHHHEIDGTTTPSPRGPKTQNIPLEPRQPPVRCTTAPTSSSCSTCCRGSVLVTDVGKHGKTRPGGGSG